MLATAPDSLLQRARGRARIAVKAGAAGTALETLYQEGCAKIRVPRTHGGALGAVLINSSGGLTGGDRVAWEAEAGPGTHLSLTTQACERVYRSLGGPATLETRLKAGAGARLDWLPQETILFDGGALERRLEVDLAEDAGFLGLEAVILGREAMGEDAFAASLTDHWRIRRAGRLVHAEAARLERENARERFNMALLDGARAYGTLVYAAPDAERRFAALAALLAGVPHAGASRIGEKIVLRAMARSGYHLRKIMVPAIAQLAIGGAIPRLWTL